MCERLVRDDVRLLTLTGPGGTGKTRLSLRAAAELSDRYADGVYFVPLATLDRPELVVQTIAEALHLRDSSGAPAVGVVSEYLSDKSVLLVIDNFEHVVEAAPAVAEILDHSPGTEVLVTSRSPLNLRAEHEYAVPPLRVPPPESRLSLADLAEYESVRLFLDRVRAFQPDAGHRHGECRGDRGGLPQPRWASARDRAGSRPHADDVSDRAVRAPRRGPVVALRRSARRRGASSEPAGHHCVELWIARRVGTAAVRQSGRLREPVSRSTRPNGSVVTGSSCRVLSRG